MIVTTQFAVDGEVSALGKSGDELGHPGFSGMASDVGKRNAPGL